MSLRPRREILEIAPYLGGDSTIEGRTDVIKLSSNEGPFGAPPGVARALANYSDEIGRYPDNSCTLLRNEIGKYFGLDPERIVCGAGSNELLYQLIFSFGGPGTELLMSEYGYSIYGIAGTLAGCSIVKAAEVEYTTQVDSLLAAVTSRTRIVCLANPNNPTGTCLGRDELARLRRELPDDVLLIVDAAYAEYVTAPDFESGKELVDSGNGNTVMTRTFSKIFGLSGARVGWCYALAHVIGVLNRVRIVFNVSGSAQAAAAAALKEEGWLERCRDHNTAYRQLLSQQLEQAGVKVVPSQTNFVLADFGSVAGAQNADKVLRSEGIIVRPVSNYGLATCLRMTIGTANECERLAGVIGRLEFA